MLKPDKNSMLISRDGVYSNDAARAALYLDFTFFFLSRTPGTSLFSSTKITPPGVEGGILPPAEKQKDAQAEADGDEPANSQRRPGDVVECRALRRRDIIAQPLAFVFDCFDPMFYDVADRDET